MNDEIELKYVEGADNGHIIRLLCANCRSKNKHTIIASSHQHAEVAGMWFDTEYYIARCNGCDQQTLSTVETSSEDINYDDRDGSESLIETVKEYPSVNISYEKPQSYFSTPDELRQICNETYAALCADAKKLASIGMRTIIEAICALNEITDDVAYDLPEKIKVLQVRQVISPTMESVLLGVKEFGDQGAHTLRMPTVDELKAGWDAIGNLLSAIYGAEDNKNRAASLKGFRKRTRSRPARSN